MKVALVRNGVVVIATTADQGYVDAVTPDWDAVLTFEDGHPVSAGWIVSGQDVEPEPQPAPVVPAEVTMRQARLALHAAGLLAGVEAAIEALEEPAKTNARIEWEYSGAVQRHNSFVSVLAPQLGLTEEQTDALFIAASAL